MFLESDKILEDVNHEHGTLSSMALVNISHDELRTLLANPSASKRADIARKIAFKFRDGILNGEEQEQVQKILRLVVKDAELLVRLALSQVLHDCPDLPHDVAVRMIEDVDAVALPVLKSCLILGDADLMPFAIGSSTIRQCALAARPVVSESLSEALVQHGDYSVHVALTDNGGAQLSEASFHALLATYPNHPIIHRKLTVRPDLPTAVVEQMLEMVADNLKEYLLAYNVVSPDAIRRVVMQAQERVTITSTAKRTTTDLELKQLVTQLHSSNRLTDNLLVRSLYSGNVRFFEYSLACRCGVAVSLVHKLLQKGNEEAFQALCQKATIPLSWIKLLRLTYAQCMVGAELRGESVYNTEIRGNLIESLLTSDRNLPIEVTEYALKVYMGETKIAV